jgi:two-component system response regulator DesR
VATVLLVDDDAMYRRALAHFLDASYDLDVVADTGSADEALVLAERLRPDAAVIDVAMPARNGVELATQLKDILPELGVVLVTGDPGAVGATHTPVLPKGDPLPVENALRLLTRGSR